MTVGDLFTDPGKPRQSLQGPLRRPRTRVIQSGGQRRDRTLKPILERARRELRALLLDFGVAVKYSPDQPRDERGRFADTGLGATVRDWQGAGFGRINDYLRYGEEDTRQWFTDNPDALIIVEAASTDEIIQRTKDEIATLDKAMKPLPAMNLNRGVNPVAFGLDSDTPRPDVAAALTARIGKRFTDTGFMSTSRGLPPKVTYAGERVRVQMHIDVPAGTSGLQLADSPEEEVLLARNTTYEVTGVDNSGAQIVASVRVVP